MSLQKWKTTLLDNIEKPRHIYSKIRGISGSTEFSLKKKSKHFIYFFCKFQTGNWARHLTAKKKRNKDFQLGIIQYKPCLFDKKKSIL